MHVSLNIVATLPSFLKAFTRVYLAPLVLASKSDQRKPSMLYKVSTLVIVPEVISSLYNAQTSSLVPRIYSALFAPCRNAYSVLGARLLGTNTLLDSGHSIVDTISPVLLLSICNAST